MISAAIGPTHGFGQSHNQARRQGLGLGGKIQFMEARFWVFIICSKQTFLDITKFKGAHFGGNRSRMPPGATGLRTSHLFLALVIM